MQEKHKIEALRHRSHLNRLIRDFFQSDGYLEVDTPLLSPFLIPEPAIEIFETTYINPYGENSRGFLIPSPELWMKRLLSRESGSIFQICKSFRNLESCSNYHNPEFTMLEWYTTDHNYLDSINVLDRLLEAVLNNFQGPSPVPECLPCLRISMKEAFHRYLDVDLDRTLEWDGIFQLCKKLNLLCSPGDSWEVLFNKIFLTYIEPHFIEEGFLVLYDYPSEIVTLARDKGNGYSERWELYIKGIEVANCYTEENNPDKIRRIIDREALKVEHRLTQSLCDWDLHTNFGVDYPPCSGVALGVDRLLMYLTGASSIDDVLAFPFFEVFGLRGFKK